MSQLVASTVTCKAAGHHFPVGDMAALRRLYLLLRLTKRFGYLLRPVAVVHENSTIAGVTVTSAVLFRVCCIDFGVAHRWLRSSRPSLFMILVESLHF